MGVESVSWGAFAGKNFRGPILLCIREICKVRKTRHENPEFGHKPDEG